MRRRRVQDDTPPQPSVFTKMKALDAYSKVHSDHTVQTNTGGLISIISIFLMAILFLSQLLNYLTVEVMDHIVVDTTLNQKLPIGLDITFPNLRCDEVSVDTVDSTGDNQVDVSGTLHKQSLDAQGKESKELSSDCLSCFGAAEYLTEHDLPTCCNTCSELKEAYRTAQLAYQDVMGTAPQCVDRQGCRIHGDVLVSKVAGNIHVAMGKSKIRDGRHVHEFNMQDLDDGFNTSHVMHRLDFGADVPGIRSPLEGVSKIVKRGAFMFHYYIKLVPTSYGNGDESERIYTHQYSVTDTSKNVLSPSKDLTGLPGVFFVYDFNPFLIQKIEKRVPFTHFLTSVCAIIGGIFTVAGIMDSFIFRVTKTYSRRDV